MNLINCLKDFVTIVNHKSFSAAAQKLYVSPSKLSKEITWLEEELKTTLFHRSTRHLKLTESGRLFYEKSAWLLGEIAAIKNIVNQKPGEPEGVLQIITTLPNAIGPMLFEFMQLYPKLKVQILVGEQLLVNTDQNFDLAITWDKVAHPNFICHRVLGLGEQIFGAPSYFKKYGMLKKASDLKKHNCLIYMPNTPKNQWILGGETIDVSGNFMSNQFELLKQAAILGEGLIFAPPIAIERELKEKYLSPAFAKKISAPARDFFVIYSKQLATSNKVQCLLEFMVSQAVKRGLVSLVDSCELNNFNVT